MTLQRIVIEMKAEEMVLRCLYKTQDGPNPGTKARRSEVTEIVRSGIWEALEALEGRVDVVGVSGYQLREDVLSATASPSGVAKATKPKRVKGSK